MSEDVDGDVGQPGGVRQLDQAEGLDKAVGQALGHASLAAYPLPQVRR